MARIKVYVKPSLDLNLNASFSYGSDEDNDDSEDVQRTTSTSTTTTIKVKGASGGGGLPRGRGRPALAQPQSNSFRLNIRKGVKDDKDDSSRKKELLENHAIDRRVRSMPLTRTEIDKLPLAKAEKLKRTAKVASAAQGQGHGNGDQGAPLRDRREIMKVNSKDGSSTLYANSWRSKNVSILAAISSSSDDEDGDDIERTNSRDDESASGPGYIGAFLSGLMLGSVKEDEREIPKLVSTSKGSSKFTRDASMYSIHAVNSTGTVEVRLSEKELRKKFMASVEAIEAGEWQVFLKNLASMERLLEYQSPNKHDKKNLFHIVASQTKVPSKVLDAMLEECPGALKQVDAHGCVPLHYAASVGRNEMAVKAFLDAMPFGASARNVDGDLPLHVAVWNGLG